MQNKRNKIITSFIISAIVAIIFIIISTILGELYSPFKTWLKETFSHHWIGKGIIAILIFYLFGFVGYFRAKENEEFVATALKVLFWISFVGVFAISGFFIYEYFIVH